MTGRLLVRSAWGKAGPAGETGPATRGLGDPLRFWMLEVGIRRPEQNAIRACDIGKNAYAKQELCRFRAMLRGVLSHLPQKLHGRLARMPQTNKNDYAKKLKSQIPQQELKDNKLNDFSFIGARVIYPNTPADEQ